MFNIIGIIAKLNDTNSKNIAFNLTDFLKKQKAIVLTNPEKIKNEAELIIVVGGDGTLLYAARCFVDDNIPILGVNLGRLGFLTDVSTTNMFAIIKEILAGKFIEEPRFLLNCFVLKNNKILHNCLAFNDAVLHRREILKMVEFDLFIDNKFVNTQRADGLIVSTPTGSTAYALSSGGAIIHPNVQAIGIVSICPSAINNRPLLVPESSEVIIHIKNTSKGVISFDGQTPITVTSGYDIKVKKHKNLIKLLHPKNYNYFNIIRSKLHWGKYFIDDIG